MERIYMTDWKQDGQYIDLTYSDNDVVRVTKTDFDRAFGAMLNADKEAVVRDFGLKDDARMVDWKQDGEFVNLFYSDHDVLKVNKSDFNRAFGAIVNATKSAIVRDFAVKDARTGLDSQISSAEDKKIDGNKPLAEKEKACSHDGLCM